MRRKLPTGGILHVDAGGGASGDMILGALLDLGVPLRVLREALTGLPVGGFTLSSRRVERAGLILRKATVRVRRSAPRHRRTWAGIRKLVEAGGLAPEVRDAALAIFRRLFEAEAEVHGRPLDRVHLHEAGGIDAIVDVVGACVGLHRLAPARVVVSTLTTGFGTVRCDHGVYPVPAPATALLVRGTPVRAGAIEAERLTPTGAAILTTVADGWGPLPAMIPRAVGYGAGDRDLGADPNALRMTLGEPLGGVLPTGSSGADAEVRVVEFDVDDATPQSLAHVAERLLADGALDVTTTPTVMKKGRAGHRLTVLVRPDRLGAVAERILRETPTLGLRYRDERRIELGRETVRVRTAYGAVTVKVGRLGDEPKAWPEYEDCAALAARKGVTLRAVQEAALAAWRVRSKPRGRKR
jgi:uncharacterized protein (TIGR00299 family) protein